MKVELFFTDIDNSLYTNEQASVSMEIKADNKMTAYLLAMKLKNVLGADDFKIEGYNEEQQ